MSDEDETEDPEIEEDEPAKIPIHRLVGEPVEAAYTRCMLALAAVMIADALEERGDKKGAAAAMSLAENLEHGHEDGQIFIADLGYRLEQVEILEPKVEH